MAREQIKGRVAPASYMTKRKLPFSSKKLRRTSLLCVVLLFFFSLPFLWKIYWKVPGNVDFFLFHARYEAIVRTVKSQPLSPGEISETLFIKGYNAWANRDKKGNYTITILTADWGHMGMAGYVYADTPPASKNDPYSDFDAPGDLWMKGERLNTHWWTVFNNLQ